MLQISPAVVELMVYVGSIQTTPHLVTSLSTYRILVLCLGLAHWLWYAVVLAVNYSADDMLPEKHR